MSAIADARYNNQKIYCKNNNLPMFAGRECSHDVTWGNEKEQYQRTNDYWDVITDEQSMGEHIISCPVCHKSFCD